MLFPYAEGSLWEDSSSQSYDPDGQKFLLSNSLPRSPDDLSPDWDFGVWPGMEFAAGPWRQATTTLLDCLSKVGQREISTDQPTPDATVAYP